MVPNGWKSVRLNKLSEFVTSGSRDWAQYYSDKGSKFIRMTNLPRDGIYLKLEDLKFVDVKSDSADGKRTSLQYGDILISITAELGKIGWVPDNLGEAYINQHTALVRPKASKCDSKYIAYLLSSHTMNHRINRLNDSGAKAGLNLPTIRSIPLIIPPLPEQRKIAQILSTWDKAITTTERLIATSQQQKKALMQQLLTGKKRLLNPETGKVFEGEWEHGFLGNLCVFKGGSAFKERYQGQTDGDYPFIKVSDMNLPKNGKFIVQANNWLSADVAKEIKAKAFEKGAVVFAKVGAALLLNRRRILVQPTIIDNNMMAAIPNKKCHTEFLYQLMLMIDFAKLVQDGAVPSINQSDLSRFKITYPMLEEQQKIASVLTAADKEIELLQAKLAHFKKEKKALMQQLLTGKRRVKIEEMEIA
ncbi:restriction endonuclease subunit S [Vibrio cholerae]|nr:restriction endonuclease subunit S [Vibrio cholerae]